MLKHFKPFQESEILNQWLTGEFKIVRDFAFDNWDRIWFVSDFTSRNNRKVVRLDDSLNYTEIPGDNDFGELRAPKTIFIKRDKVYIGDDELKKVLIYDAHNCKLIDEITRKEIDLYSKKEIENMSEELRKKLRDIDRLFPKKIVVLGNSKYILNSSANIDGGSLLKVNEDKSLEVIKGLEEKVYDITAGPYHKNPEKYAVYVLQRIENGTNDKFRVEEIIGKKGVKSFEERGYEHLAVDKEGHLYLYQSISGLLEFEHEHQIDIHFYNKPDEYDALEFPKKEMAIATYMRKIDCMKFDNQDRLFVVGREHNSESCLIQRCEKKF